MYVMSLSGQCPGMDSLYKTLDFFDTTNSMSSAEKLKELQRYDLQLKTCPARYDSVYSELLKQIAALYYFSADYIKAIQYLRRSIGIIEANEGKPFIDSKKLITKYFWLSVFYDSVNNITEKMKAVDSCIDIAIRLKSSSDISCIRAMASGIEYAFDVGDYHRCINYATISEAVAKEYANGNSQYRLLGEQLASNSLLWKVNALLQLKNYQAAEEFLANKVEESKQLGLINHLGTIYALMAKVQISKGNYKKAIAYYEQAFGYEKKSGYKINCKTILNNIGYDIYFKHFNDADKALEYCRKALTYIDKSVKKIDAFESLDAYTNIGNIYAHKYLYDSAFKYFQLAFDQIGPGTTENDLLNSPPDIMRRYKRIEYLVDLLIDKADVYREKYRVARDANAFHESIRIYKVADQLINKIKTEQSDFQSRLFWRSDTRRLYEHAIEACYDYKDTTEAFYFFERSRAILLNDELNEQRWLREDDMLTQMEIKKKMLQLDRELRNTDANSKRYIEIQREQLSLKQKLDRFIELIKEHNPLYQGSLDSSTITISDIRKDILSDHAALVEIFTGDSAVYVMSITSAKNYFSKINKHHFDSLTNAFTRYISSAELLNSQFDKFLKTSHQLYQLIVENNPLPAGRVIISPEGRYFPFEALVTNASSAPIYFVNDHAVSYTYSARYLMNNFAGATKKTGNFLGVAPVQYASVFSLSSLPGSDASLSTIRPYFTKTNMLVEKDATRNNFLRQFSNYAIIQLYTHASDSSNNHEPVIYFADSVLYLSDLIAENKPSTRLMVLSACETGNGILYQGEGVFSFNRAFASIGIPSSIINLWSVDNEATYRLTEIFYKYLSQGLPTDLALQKAKLEFMETSKANSMPYFWAAPILAGRTETLIDKEKNLWKYVAVVAIAVGGLIFWGWRRRML